MTPKLRPGPLAGAAAALLLAATSPRFGLIAAGGPGQAPSSRPATASRPGTPPATARSAPAPIPRPVAEDAASVRRRMVAVLLDQTNRARVKNHLRPLALSAELSAAAQAHAEDMLTRGYFSHESPEGESTPERVTRLAPRAIVLSVRENILKTEGHEDDAPQVRAVDFIDGWMDSPGHRRNLLADDVADVGFGIASTVEKGRLTEYAVQVLGRVVGSWSRTPASALRSPDRLRARLTVPVDFFLEDSGHPRRRYKDPADGARSWLGGVRLLVVTDAQGSVVELPRLDPGRYRLLGRLARDDGYQALREIRVLGPFEGS